MPRVHPKGTRVIPPTIVLVHGAFAESASWDRVIRELEGAGHEVIAAANPLRGRLADGDAVSDRAAAGRIVFVVGAAGVPGSARRGRRERPAKLFPGADAARERACNTGALR